MGIFSKPETVILKEGSSSREQLAALESLRGRLAPGDERRLEADIRSVKAGIAGEDRILYELRNSHLDMVVLHDLFLEHGGLTAQIDFLVLTPRRNFVLESKNLYGDIEVDSKGNFARSFAGRKEGIYSPITQNERHLELIHAMKRDERGTLLNMLVDGDFYDVYRAYVVLANPKTVLRDRYAKREVRDKIVRADRLVAAIKEANGEPGAGHDAIPMSRVLKSAERFLSLHKDNPVDYVEKYEAVAEENAGSLTGKEAAAGIACPRCGAPMVLRTARRGANAGNQFYGCSNYPRCRGIVNLK